MSQRHDMTPEEIAARFPNGALPSVAVTQRSTTVSQPTVVETPVGMPDVILVPLTVTRRLAIRTAKSYVSSLIVLLFAGAVSLDPTAPADLWARLVHAAGYSLAPAVGTLLLNLSILLTRLDESNPELMG